MRTNRQPVFSCSRVRERLVRVLWLYFRGVRQFLYSMPAIIWNQKNKNRTRTFVWVWSHRGAKFDRLVKNWSLGQIWSFGQKLTVWSKIDRLVKFDRLVKNWPSGKIWSSGKIWPFDQNAPFSFRSVLLLFCSLFVLFSFCSFDVCVCVRGVVWIW